MCCFWLHPDAQHKGDYEKPEAKEDFKKAESFFQVDINPLASNPLNLYDDVHNAFIVNLFKGSDKICFYVLSEFRKAINFNVTMLSVIFSLIVSVVAVLNILWSRSVDFYKLAGVPQGRWLPPTLPFFSMEFQTQAVVNLAIFGAASCAIGFGLMWLFYHIAYDQSQRHNGLQLNAFLVRYLSDINIQFTKIHTRATQAVVEGDDLEEMKTGCRTLDDKSSVDGLSGVFHRGVLAQRALSGAPKQHLRAFSYPGILHLLHVVSCGVAEYSPIQYF